MLDEKTTWRRRHGETHWHFVRRCSKWPMDYYDFHELRDPATIGNGPFCPECASLYNTR